MNKKPMTLQNMKSLPSDVDRANATLIMMHPHVRDVKINALFQRFYDGILQVMENNNIQQYSFQQLRRIARNKATLVTLEYLDLYPDVQKMKKFMDDWTESINKYE